MTSIAVARDHPAEIRRTLQLATPVMIGLVASLGMNFVDTVMAGRLPDKDVALAALATGGALWSAMLMLALGVLMALQPVVAQLDGAGLKQEAAAAARQAFWLALAVALPFTGLMVGGGEVLSRLDVDAAIVPTADGYLGALAWGAPAMCLVFLLRFFSEGTGHTRPTMYIGLFGVVVNVPLNWVLMFGKLGLPAMGARGCGYATSIVIWLQVLLLWWYVRGHHHFRGFALFSRWDWPNLSSLREMLRIGLPIAVTIFVESSLFVAAALLIGRLGPIPTAGHLIAINFSALMFMIPAGLTSAVTTRVGNAIGRGEPGAARYAGLIGLFLVLCSQTISAAVMLLLPGAIVSIYTSDETVAAVAVALLFYAAIFQLPDGIQICAAGALRGLKDTFVPMFYNVVSYWLVGLTCGYYLTFQRELGPAGMWVGMIAGLSIGAVLMATRFLRTSRRLQVSEAATPVPGP
ncbi:MAG: MATE family efflux transporter [Xanthomonadales bacterium]|nr:MATE family efflux transporter [Xanthomonadales bacterium]NIN60004.1 MATE family efflux transporter [Xanthomonadales bacterium]NIN75372.1 MATE family efflux transporter [Xanthomonadales bacterium]NIO14195.1 MATE family efflux transporter [Xanthomonadales bacterium]NIP12397.1 MATE family efflux transporter [Xanthomonadales bacterium]